MANSYVTYTGNGATTAYSVPFPYIFKSHVKVYLNNVLTSAYTWTASNTITFATAPPSGQPITIIRRTQSDPLVDFTAKSRWQTSDLNLAIRQSFYLAEEAEDAAGYVQAGNGIELSFGADGKLTITNIGTPGGGSGNVIGPVSSVNGNIPVFSGPSGRLIVDSGVLAANVVQGPVSSVNGNLPVLSGTTGRLIADSGIASSGGNLAMATPFGNRSAIINGDLSIWQRGTSIVNPAALAYTADQWPVSYNGTGASRTISRGTFSVGSTEAFPGAAYFLVFSQTVAGSGGTWNELAQNMEGVRAYSGQQITISFWARMFVGTPVLPILYIRQYFGTGGSAQVDTIAASNVVMSGGFARYSFTVTLPSIAGKTIGTNDSLQLRFGLPVNAVFEFHISGVRIDPGPLATPFESRPAAVELALCQRYFFSLPDNVALGLNARVYNYSAASASVWMNYQLPVPMRALPTVTAQIDINDGAIINPGSIAVPSTKDIVISHGPVPAGQWVDLRALTASAEL